jgi:hypothetical protein
VKPTLTEISELSFADTPSWNRVVEHTEARRYAILNAGLRRGNLGIAWRSDQIEPLVRQSLSGERWWIAIDQAVASIDMKSERVVLILPLNSNVLDMVVRDLFVVVLCETEAVVLNTDGSIRLIRSLPDLPDSVIDSNGEMGVALSDGNVIMLR